MIQLVSVDGDSVQLLYHAAENLLRVGDSIALLEQPTETQGIISQVIRTETLSYEGLQAEMIQRALEARLTEVDVAVDGETGMAEMGGLKLATAKIRKTVRDGQWHSWDGWTPTRHVSVSVVTSEEVLARALPAPRAELPSFARFQGTSISIDGTRLNMINVVTGRKNSGKSHLAKHLVIALSERKVPCVVFDVNGEYTGLPHANALRWGEDFFAHLGDVGWEMLRQIVRSLYPFNPGSPSESVFESRLPNIFAGYRSRSGESLDIPYLMRQSWGGGEFVERAIQSRLEMVEGMGLFWQQGLPEQARLNELYDEAVNGAPLVFDMRRLSAGLQSALVKAMNRQIERLCDEEAHTGRNAWPFLIYEEAHGYASQAAILNIITRCRHFGMASVFVTNSPELLDPSVFRQIDSLFLLRLTNKDDIRTVGKAALVDQDTIEALVSRMPERHCLMVGNVAPYPLVVEIDPLPRHVPTSGQTRSTWDRFATEWH